MLATSAGLSGEWNKALFIGAFALAFGGIGFGSVRKMPLTDVVGIGTLIGMESRKTLYYRTL